MAIRQSLAQYRPVRYSWELYEFILWRMRGRPGVPPAFVKRRIAKEYAKRFKPRIFIETGTFRGDMVRYVRPLFQRLVSIELSSELAQKARRSFARYPNIQIITGDSPQELPKILASLDEPCLFWLDAHFSGGSTSGTITRRPVSEELESILTNSNHHHVILLDDAICFGKDPSYPSLDDILNMISRTGGRYEVSMESDVIRLVPIEHKGP